MCRNIYSRLTLRVRGCLQSFVNHKYCEALKEKKTHTHKNTQKQKQHSCGSGEMENSAVENTVYAFWVR